MKLTLALCALLAFVQVFVVVDGQDVVYDDAGIDPVTDVRAEDTEPLVYPEESVDRAYEDDARPIDEGEEGTEVRADEGAEAVGVEGATGGNENEATGGDTRSTDSVVKHSPQRPPPQSTQPQWWGGNDSRGCPPCWAWFLGIYIPPYCPFCYPNWSIICWLCQWFPLGWLCWFC